MCESLTAQVRSIGSVTTAVARGDLSKTIEIEAEGEMAVLKDTVNSMVKQLTIFAGEVTRVALEVGTQGILGGQAVVDGVEGVWADLTTNVNVGSAVKGADSRKWLATLRNKYEKSQKSPKPSREVISPRLSMPMYKERSWNSRSL